MLLDDSSNLTEQILTENLIILEDLSSIYRRLTNLPPEQCSKYELIDLSNISKYWMMLIFSINRRELIEPLNSIIAERRSFIENIVGDTQLNAECAKLLYPPKIAEQTYVPLTQYALSGAFAIL